MKFIQYVQFMISIWLILAVIVVIVNSIFHFYPLQADDFVVDKNSDVIVFSNFDHRFYIFGPDWKIKKTFSIPESKGIAKLAIDEQDNIYIARGGVIKRYDLNGNMVILSLAQRGAPENWRLINYGMVKYFQIPEPGWHIYSTKRLRCIAKPGDILFYDNNIYTIPQISDPFSDNKGMKYVCKQWRDGIKVYDESGNLIKELNIPIYLKLFILPLGMYLWVTGISIVVLIEFAKQKLKGLEKLKRGGA